MDLLDSSSSDDEEGRRGLQVQGQAKLSSSIDPSPTNKKRHDDFSTDEEGSASEFRSRLFTPSPAMGDPKQPSGTSKTYKESGNLTQQEIKAALASTFSTREKVEAASHNILSHIIHGREEQMDVLLFFYSQVKNHFPHKNDVEIFRILKQLAGHQRPETPEILGRDNANAVQRCDTSMNGGIVGDGRVCSIRKHEMETMVIDQGSVDSNCVIDL